jgi:hypothetical protein
MSSEPTIPKTPADWKALFDSERASLLRDHPLYEGARKRLAYWVGCSGEYGVPWTEATREAKSLLADQYPEHVALRVVTAKELLDSTPPEAEPLIGPFCMDEMALLFAARGTGKTLVALGIASAAAAGGSFLNWKAPTPRRVLYVDGELPVRTLHERVKLAIDSVHEGQEDPRENLRILSVAINRKAPNLAEPKGFEAVEAELEEGDFLVLDSLSTLCRGGEENSAESWQPMQDRLVALRARSIASLALHHAGKSGTQRGTTKREDVYDWILKLSHPADYSPTQGARFELTFDKARHFRGADAVAPFEAQLDTIDGRPVWTTKLLSRAVEDRMLRLAREGLSVTEIAREVGRNKSTVSRFLQKAREDGRLESEE